MEPDRSPFPLTTTSYVVLGLLCLREWTAYELAQQMARGWDDVWPRATSGIYREPKKLVAAGYATGRRSSAGGRSRAVYSVTDEGRAAFRRWLSSSELDEPKLECEAVVRVLFGELGDEDALLAAVRSVRSFALERSLAFLEQGQAYLERGGPFPERLHVIQLAGRFLAEYHGALIRWANWAEGELGRWSTVSSPDGVPDLESLGQAVARAFEQNVAAAGEPRTP